MQSREIRKQRPMTDCCHNCQRAARSLVPRIKDRPKRPAVGSVIPEQMKLAAQLVMHRDHGAVDVADQTVAKCYIRDFPVAPAANIRHRLNSGDAGGLASRLAAKRFVRDLRQVSVGLSDRRHWWPRPSSSSARAFVMLRM